MAYQHALYQTAALNAFPGALPPPYGTQNGFSQGPRAPLHHFSPQGQQPHHVHPDYPYRPYTGPSYGAPRSDMNVYASRGSPVSQYGSASGDTQHAHYPGSFTSGVAASRYAPANQNAFTPSREGTPSPGPGRAQAMNANAPSFTPKSGSRSSPFSGDHRRRESGKPFSPQDGSSPLPLDRRDSLPRIHRISPSVSMTSGSTRPGRQPGLGPPQLLKSPIASRGVSPVGSNFSTATDSTPLLNAFGLPIVMQRVYKVKFPIEASVATEGLAGDEAKPSIWHRRPLSIDPSDVGNSHRSTQAEVQARSKSPHPGDRVIDDPLPETLEIFLPNDWITLRQALFEERMGKLGITRDLPQSMNQLLVLKNDARDNASETATVAFAPFAHKRSGSLAAPLPDAQPSTSPFAPSIASPFVRGHGPSMSIAAPGVAGLFSGTKKGFLREQAPFGPRDFSFGRSPEARGMPHAMSAAIAEENENEDEDTAASGEPSNDQAEPEQPSLQGASLKPARLMSLKELSAGFGIISDSEAATRPSSPTIVAKDIAEEGSAPPLQERVAIEGVLDHRPLPSIASLGDMPASDSHLLVHYDSRRSLSAPDLHQLVTQSALAQSAPTPDGYTAEDSQAEDSDGETEYSNPSDEEQARARRDRGLLSGPPTASITAGAIASTIPSPQHEVSHDQRTTWHSPSSSLPAPAKLNAAAPPFTFGQHQALRSSATVSMSSSFSHEDSKQENWELPHPSTTVKPLNVGAPDFKPSLGIAQAMNVDAPDFRPSWASATSASDTGVQTRNPSLPGQNGSEVLLAKAVHDDLPNTSQNSTGPLRPDEGVANKPHDGPLPPEMSSKSMRTFKFPPSPQLRPISPAMQPSPMSAVPPQIPPFGTIGRNTFRNALSDLTFAPRGGYLSDAASPTRSMQRPRPHLPDFGDVVASNEHTADPVSLDVSVASPSLAHAVGAPASESYEEQVGETIAGVAMPEAFALHLRLGTGTNGIEANEGMPESDVTSQHSVSDSVPSSIVRALQSQKGSGDMVSLNQSWKIFEALLDRKLDALRLDVFSNSTPLPPPPISAEAQELLTAAVVEAIREEMPLSSISNAGRNIADETLSQPLLDAIHETQDMLQDFRGRSDSSVKDIVDLLQRRVAGSESNGPSRLKAPNDDLLRDLAANLEQSLERVWPKLFSYDEMAIRTAQEVTTQLQNNAGLSGNIDMAELIARHVETLLKPAVANLHAAVQLAMANTAINSAQTTTTQESLRLALLDCLPDIASSLLPTVTPLPSSPASNIDHLQSIIDNQERRNDRSFERVLSLLEHLQSTNVDANESTRLQQALLEAQTRLEATRQEVLVQRQHFDKEALKRGEDLQYVRSMSAAKDKQVEVLRSELLQRATVMDREGKEREREHARQLNEMRALCGGMEAELSVMKAQAQSAASQRDDLQSRFETLQKQYLSLDKQHHAEMALVEERERVARIRMRSLEGAEKETRAQIDRLTTQLDGERQLRSRGEGRAEALQAQCTVLQDCRTSLEAKVAHLSSSEASLTAKVQACEADLEKSERERIQATCNNTAELLEWKNLHSGISQLAAGAQQALLSVILSQNVDSECYPSLATLSFESAYTGHQQQQQPARQASASPEALDADDELDYPPKQLVPAPGALSERNGEHDARDCTDKSSSLQAFPLVDDSGWFDC